MNTINVRDLVRAAIQSSWPEFREAHPHLAAVIDEDLLIEGAVAQLADDPEYKSAMAQALGAGIVAQTAQEIVSRFVIQWMRRLI